MFDNLTKRFHNLFRNIAGYGRLSEKNMEDSFRRIRTSLLEADVNYKVVIDFIARVRSQAKGRKVLNSITPAQMLIKIVYDELTALLGGGGAGLDFSGNPAIIMIAGLHGSGKTTSCAKLARRFLEMEKKPLLAALDMQRPAAVEQLEMLGKQMGVEVCKPGKSRNMVSACEQAVKQAKKSSADVVILDTAGRWHIEEDLVKELEVIKKRFAPGEILLTVDATTGQDAVNIAGQFNDRLDITGYILTKVDGDSRGGAAVSIRAVTGKPIKFMGVGERPADLQEFFPDRIASRILGMGDILTLVEKIEKVTSQEEKDKKARQKKKKQDINLEDFLKSIKQIRKIAPLADMMKMLPVGGALSGMGKRPDREMKKIEAIISSMTTEERRNPDILDGSRRKRVAEGSGSTAHDINLLIQRFAKMKKSMKKMQNNMGPGGQLGQLGKMGKLKIPRRPFPPRW